MWDTNLNSDQNVPRENTIIVKTAHVEKLKPKKKEKELKKNYQKIKLSKEEEFRRKTRTRLMITFETEDGYKLLLADTKELFKLKKTSYLNLKFLEQNNQYRVHLYYRDGLRTRFSHWLPKYPQVKKTIKKDEPDIGTKVELENNSLSKAIAAIQFEADSQESLLPTDLRHENPPILQEHIKGHKKIKANEKKTKSELLLENENLKADLEQNQRKLSILENDRLQDQRKMRSLIDQQELYKSVFSDILKKLSPTAKTQYEHIFDKNEEEEKDLENTDANVSGFFFESPKSRVPTEIEKGSAHHYNSAKSSENKKLTSEMEILFPENEIEGNNGSISCIHTSDDEVKPLGKSPVQKSTIVHIQQTTQALSKKKTNDDKKKLTVQKTPWNNFREDVLNIWRGIKTAMQRGESEEQIRQNKKNPNNWKTVLAPDYKYREIFQAFLKSQTD